MPADGLGQFYPPLPSLLQLVNLEKKTTPTFLTTVFIGGESFHQSRTSLPENGSLGKGKLSPPPSAWTLLVGSHCPQGRAGASQILDNCGLPFRWPQCPEAKKPLQEIKCTKQCPCQLSPRDSAETPEGHLCGCSLLSWYVVWWHTLAHETGSMGNSKNKDYLYSLKKKKKKKKGGMFCLIPTTTQTFREKSALLSCNKGKG